MREETDMDEVEKYLRSDIYTPFFLVVGDSDYVRVKDNLLAKGLNVIAVSDYFRADRPDRTPNLDEFKNALANNGNSLVIGLGEYLALCGTQTASEQIRELLYHNLGKAKACFLLRGIERVVRQIQFEEKGRLGKKSFCFFNDTSTSLSVTCVSSAIALPSARDGLKGILVAFEDGQKNVVAKTTQTFGNPIADIRIISTAYDGIKHLIPTFVLPRSCGSDENWNDLFAAITAGNGSLDAAFGSYNLPNNLLDEFGQFIQGTAFANWLYFVALKLKATTISNSYLRFVLDKSETLGTFKHNVLNAIIDLPHTDKRFDKFYSERKLLIEKFSEHELTDFVNNNGLDINESLYRLTDLKHAEREEFIVLFGKLDKKTVLARIESVYPDLYDYLYPYTFTDSKINVELCKLLTEYFEKYKWQKVLNKVNDDFVAEVEALANDRQYPFLPSRAEVINEIDKTGTFLYWLDALGVEFLGFIQNACKRIGGLSLKIHIGRAELPTLTCLNKDFYNTWDEVKRESDKRLDEVKHKTSGGYNYSDRDKLPVHLIRELEVIYDVLEKIATKLFARRDIKKVLLVSDHGASRLAVRNEQEEKYETDTKGEHGGRCCKVFPDYALPFATEENGYLVLANYGRFKKSRAANVEVHGGATLEEVVVPIIEITLANPNITVKLVKETVYADYKTCAVVELFTNTKLDNVSIHVKGMVYAAERIDDKHYRIVTDIKRAGDYPADVYAGDDLIGKIMIKAQGKSGKVNDAFDDLF
jgi:hypothetical protein